MKNTILQGENISKIFVLGQSKNKVLEQTTVSVFEKDFSIIMGASGAGKSTLLYTLSGMEQITEGKILYKGKKVHCLKEKQMAELRAKEFGFIFQQAHLISHLTLFENVAVAGYISKKDSTLKIRKRAQVLLKEMGIEKAGNRLPSQVSGGEAQRAAIARAMIGNPGLLFADEPTGALNKSYSTDVLNLLTQLNTNGQSILMVTHDLRAAVRGNRILYMEDGKILDELNLPPYKEAEEKQREASVSEWLSKLQW